MRRDVILSPTRCVADSEVSTWAVARCPFAVKESGRWECWLYKITLDDDGSSPNRCTACTDGGDHVVIHKVPI